MTTKPSPDGLLAAKSAQSPALAPKAAGHSAAEAQTGEAGEYSFLRGQLVGLLLYVTVYRH